MKQFFLKDQGNFEKILYILFSLLIFLISYLTEF